MSLAASGRSHDLGWELGSGSVGHLEGLLSEQPKFKDALRASWSSSFNEVAS